MISDSDIEHVENTGSTTQKNASTEEKTSTPKTKKKDKDATDSREMINKLMSRADNIEELRKKMFESSENKNPQEKKVDKFVDYLKTQLLDIPQNCWFQFTVECMELVDKYTEETQLPSFNTGYSSGSYSHTMQASQSSSNYGHNTHGQSGGNYTKRSQYGVTPRHFGSQMYGGAATTNPRNESIQASTGYSSSQSISTTPISPLLMPSGNVGQASSTYSAHSGAMYSQLTAPTAGKSMSTGCSHSSAVSSVSTDNDDLPGFNENLFNTA